MNTTPKAKEDSIPALLLKLAIAIIFLLISYVTARDYCIHQHESKLEPVDENAYLSDIPPPNDARLFSGMQSAIPFDQIETKLVEHLKTECRNPELFSVVKVDRAMTEKMGLPMVEIKYWTVDEYGERQLRIIAAVLKPDGTLHETRYHIEHTEE